MSFFRVMLVAVVVIGTNLTIHAQATKLKGRAGFGLSLPMYEIEEGIENQTGWSGIGAIEYDIHPNIGLFLEGYHASHGIEIDEISGSEGDVSISITGGFSGSLSASGTNAGILLRSASDPVTFYGIAGAGYGQGKITLTFLGTDESEDETGLSIVLGAGVRYSVNNMIKLYLEGRYSRLFTEEFDSGDRLNFLPVTAGLVFSF